MTRKKPIKNMAASVRARLLERSTAEGRAFSDLLQRYAMERFLYRLSRSPHADTFSLKGALMLTVWGGPIARSTKDIDLLRRESASVEQIEAMVTDCLRTEVPDDGLRFDHGTVVGEEIRADAEYDGVRVRFTAYLENARIPMQVDVGFGDVITPQPARVRYPTLLDSRRRS